VKILQQTAEKLVIGTPASAILWVRLIGLAISFPGLLALAIFIFGGSGDYSSLNCHHNRSIQRQCRFLRLSLVRPFYYRFPIAELNDTRLQTYYQSQRGPSGQRLMLQVGERRFPLTVSYSGSQAQLSQVQSFIKDPTSPPLVIRKWPNLWGLVVVFVFLIPTLPLSLLVICIAASPVTVWFDKKQRQIRVSIGGLIGPTKRQCSFQEVEQIYVERTLVGGHSTNKQPTERYALLIELHSGKPLLRFDYFEQQPAEEIAQAMRQFLQSDR
jgi:hypothetical protein